MYKKCIILYANYGSSLLTNNVIVRSTLVCTPTVGTYFVLLPGTDRAYHARTHAVRTLFYSLDTRTYRTYLQSMYSYQP